MALQASGEIRMSQINTELGRTSSLLISLNEAENGTYETINAGSPSYLSATNPASMSEWYSYNHTHGNLLTLTSTVISGSPEYSFPVIGNASTTQTITYTWKYVSNSDDIGADVTYGGVVRAVGYTTPTLSEVTTSTTTYTVDNAFTIVDDGFYWDKYFEFVLLTASIDTVPTSPDNKVNTRTYST